MTDTTFTHIAMLLDRSGSMSTIRRDTERGFDAYVAEQRTQPGRCTMTLAQFDDSYEQVFSDVPIAEVTSLQLTPRGSTALLDAIGRLIVDTGARLAALPEDRRPGTVIVGIMTDGHENASVEYDHAAIKKLIEQQESTYDWQFMYLGANQDAIEVGAGMGFSRERSLTYSGDRAGAAYGAAAQMSNRMRSARAAGVSPAAVAFTDEERVGADSGTGAVRSTGAGPVRNRGSRLSFRGPQQSRR